MKLEELKKKYFTLNLKGISLGTLVRLIGAVVLIVLLRSKFHRPDMSRLHPLLIRRINISDAIYALPQPVWHVDIDDCETPSVPLNATSLNFTTLNTLIAKQAFSPTGLIPENDLDHRYLLRPKYFEQLFWAYVITDDSTYQDISWQAFLRANRTCRDEDGVWHGVKDVRNRTGVERIYGIPAVRVARLLRWALLTQREGVDVVQKHKEGKPLEGYGDICKDRPDGIKCHP